MLSWRIQMPRRDTMHSLEKILFRPQRMQVRVNWLYHYIKIAYIRRALYNILSVAMATPKILRKTSVNVSDHDAHVSSP